MSPTTGWSFLGWLMNFLSLTKIGPKCVAWLVSYVTKPQRLCVLILEAQGTTTLFVQSTRKRSNILDGQPNSIGHTCLRGRWWVTSTSRWRTPTPLLKPIVEQLVCMHDCRNIELLEYWLLVVFETWIGKTTGRGTALARLMNCWACTGTHSTIISMQLLSG